MDADLDVIGRDAEREGGCLVVDMGHALHLEIVVARSERAALVGPAIQRPLAHAVRLGTFQTAVCFGVFNILISGPVDALKVLGTSFQQFAQLTPFESIFPSSSGSGGRRRSSQAP